MDNSTNPPLSLLQRLKQQAEEKKNSADQKQGLQEQQRKSISAAMSAAYSYLRELVEQVNVLNPPSPAYYLNEQLQFSDLAWTEGRADLRRIESATDDHLIKTVSLRYALAGVRPLVIEKDALGIPPMKQILDDYGLQFEIKETKNAKARTESACFTIKCEVRAGLLFTADYDVGDIHLRTVNVQRFGNAEYRIPAETLTRAVVEEIALLVLGESNQFVRRFKRIS